MSSTKALHVHADVSYVFVSFLSLGYLNNGGGGGGVVGDLPQFMTPEYHQD